MTFSFSKLKRIRVLDLKLNLFLHLLTGVLISSVGYPFINSFILLPVYLFAHLKELYDVRYRNKGYNRLDVLWTLIGGALPVLFMKMFELWRRI